MGEEGSVESAVMAGEGSVAEGIGLFLPLGLIRLPFAMVYTASKVRRIGKGKLFVELNLFRKWAVLCGFGLSKNSHLGQNAIGALWVASIADNEISP